MKTSSEIKREILTLLHASMMTDMTYKELEAKVETSANFDVIMSRMDGTLIKCYERDGTTYVTITMAGLVEYHKGRFK